MTLPQGAGSAGARAEPGPELAALIGLLRMRDVRFAADGDALHYDAPPHVMTGDLLARLRENKQGLLRWLAARADEPTVESSGPATLSQRRMRAQHLASGSPAGFNVAQRIPLSGRLDPAALGRALTALTSRQSALRSRLAEYGTDLVQEVLPPAEVPLPLTDLRELPEDERARAAEEWVRRQADEPFDLGVAPYLRTALLRTDEERWTLMVVLHHVVIDGWGLDVLLRDLGALYTAALRVPGPRPPDDAEAGLLPLAMTYPEVGAWQRGHLSGVRLERLRAFWREELADASLRLALPYDRPRPERLSGRGDEVSLCVPAGLAAAVRELAADRGTTVFTVLLAAFGALLCRLTGQREAVVACNIANRVRQEHEALVGHFTNNVALRLRPGDGGGFAALVGDTGRRFFAAVDHQDYPLSMMLEDRTAQPAADEPAFPQVIVVMQNQAAPVLDLPGTTSEVHDVAVGGAKAELVLVLVPGADGIECVLNYATELFDASTVRQWGSDYLELLDRAVRAPQLPPAAPAGGEPDGAGARSRVTPASAQ